MAEGDLKVRDRLDADVGVDLGEPLLEDWHLRRDAERSPGHGREAEPIEEVRVLRLVERVVEVHVDVGLDVHPAHGGIVAPGQEAVAHAEAPDRPAIDGIDGSELREIDRVQLGGRLVAIELQNIGGIGNVARDPGEVCERLDDVLEAVEAQGGALRAFPGARDFEGRFYAAVEDGAEFVAALKQASCQSGTIKKSGMNGLSFLKMVVLPRSRVSS